MLRDFYEDFLSQQSLTIYLNRDFQIHTNKIIIANLNAYSVKKRDANNSNAVGQLGQKIIFFYFFNR